MNVTILSKPPRVGLVSLGCPKALVDSERIMTKLRADGYDMSPDYAGADVVLVNTCGFLDSATAATKNAETQEPGSDANVPETANGSEAVDQNAADAQTVGANGADPAADNSSGESTQQ